MVFFFIILFIIQCVGFFLLGRFKVQLNQFNKIEKELTRLSWESNDKIAVLEKQISRFGKYDLPVLISHEEIKSRIGLLETRLKVFEGALVKPQIRKVGRPRKLDEQNP